ncbi:MAG: hypothetical protein WC479_05360 [Candidatus Izemoplasmatales bacterium]|jgi:hypothetical protein|nr:hypothetical protein [Candidatus Izemoplasmatales bacterium]MDD3865243.1 hypothetical protein [Candidatus Izemoplasmatales bacterium]
MLEFSKYYVEFFQWLWQDIKDFFVAIWNDFFVALYTNIKDYISLLITYQGHFDVVAWIMVAVTALLNTSLVVFVIAKIIIWFRKYASFRRVEIEKNELIEEIATLNDKVVSLVEEKNQIMAMKVSQLGINAATGQHADQVVAAGAALPGRAFVQPAIGMVGGNTTVMMAPGQSLGRVDGSGQPTDSPAPNVPVGPSRFVKLIQVDKEYAGKDTHIYMEESDFVTLPEMVTRFVNYSAAALKLYYKPKMISLFFAGMAASKVMILQGISGTGKTSLPYAMAKFFSNSASMISVQPSWRDRAEILGYLNEFTKRFNETDFLKALYEASYRKDVNFIVLDEMNLARIEYYFAEFLSIMEMPDPSEWKIDLVPDSKPSDPLKVLNGKINVPLNVWFIGTANKDDSTFTITDKVYDRAIALEFESKGEFFQAPETDPLHMNYSYLQELFDEAYYKYPVSQVLLDKFAILDKYVQNNFKIAFGNRIMVQLHKFIPVYVACGGTEEDGLDYIFANKILRKFESLNLSFLRNEMDDLITQITKIFGKNNFAESIKFVKNLQKQI